jgi:mono/diheme cytochrome c family protein
MRWLIAAPVLGFLCCTVGATVPPAASSSTEMQPLEKVPPAVVPLERTASPARAGSTVALARLRGRPIALVCDTEGNAVHLVDLDTAEEASSLPVPGARQLLVLADGRVAVASRDRDAVVVLAVDADRKLLPSAIWPTAAEPTVLAATPDDATLLVGTARDPVLEAHEAATGTRHVTVRLEAVPSALAGATDGRHVLVAHSVASDVEVVDLATTKVTKQSLDATGLDVDPVGFDVSEDHGKTWSFCCGMVTAGFMNARESLPVRARHARAFVAGGSPTRTFVVHELMAPAAPPGLDLEGETATGYGSGALDSSEHVGVSTLDSSTGKRVAFARAEGGCRLPRGVGYDDRRARLLVACAGSDAIVAFARRSGVRRNQEWLERRSPSFVAVAKTPVPFTPDGIAIDAEGDRAVVSSRFGGALAIAKLGEAAPPVVVRLSSAATLPANVERGRALFFRAGDARIAADGRACASCHIDGEADGLVWKTPRGPRSTPVLASRLDRDGPFGWKGESLDLTEHVRKTIRRNLSGKGLASNDMGDMVAFLRWQPSDRPHPALRCDDSRDPLVARGKAVFESPVTGCAECHGGDLYTDEDRHRVGSGGAFVTPALVGLARSAPYFHDGRYRTLEDLLSRTSGRMGSSKDLSPDDRAALVAFLHSI